MILTNEDFAQKVLDQSGIVFVEFFASWCPHCQAFAPEYKQISEDLASQAKFYQVEIDQSKGLANEYNITAIPTIVVFDNGNIEGEFQGAQSQQVFEEAIQEIQNN